MFDHSAQFEALMSRIFQFATAAAVGMTALAAIATTVPGFASQSPAPAQTGVVFESTPVIQAIDPEPVAPAADDTAANDPIEIPAADSLRQLVAAIQHAEPTDEELRCIATGVYYESRAEPHDGQLAVAHVILNRAKSGRFAPTPCAVLTQRGQFSFVRGGVVPTPPRNAQWRTAVAIARIAIDGDWRNPVPEALFFHASRISPGWGRPRIARLGNHIFYR